MRDDSPPIPWRVLYGGSGNPKNATTQLLLLAKLSELAPGELLLF